MSYDVMIRGEQPDALAKVDALARKHACECVSTAQGRTIALTLDDAGVARLYKALVETARVSGLALFDPQAGRAVDLEVPGRYPPGWVPSGPLAGRSLDAKVKSLIDDWLQPQGFTPVKKGVAERQVSPELVQGFWFTRGTSSRTGLFRVEVLWAFTFEPRADGAADSVFPLEALARGGGRSTSPAPLRSEWLRAGNAKELDASFAKVQSQIKKLALPLLSSVSSIEALVSAYESGALDGRVVEGTAEPMPAACVAFGRYRTAQHMARCYRHLDRLADGRERFFAYLDALAATPIRYVYQAPDIWPERSEEEQREQQDRARAEWVATERVEGEAQFR